MKTLIAMLMTACLILQPIRAELLPEDHKKEQRTLNKLKTITIPKAEFRKAGIQDVVKFLKDQSVKLDRSEDPVKGVNFILNLKGKTQSKEIPGITLMVKQVSLLELLKLVTDIMGLKYRVMGSVVMIVPKDVSEKGQITIRTYSIPLTIVKDIRTKGAKAYFEEMGVKFPEGASAKYVGGVGKLIVANTPENLQVLERILSSIGGRRIR